MLSHYDPQGLKRVCLGLGARSAAVVVTFSSFFFSLGEGLGEGFLRVDLGLREAGAALGGAAFLCGRGDFFGAAAAFLGAPAPGYRSGGEVNVIG